MTIPRVFLAGLMLLLPLCACGSDGDSGPSTSPTDAIEPTPTTSVSDTSSAMPPQDEVAGDTAVWKVGSQQTA